MNRYSLMPPFENDRPDGFREADLNEAAVRRTHTRALGGRLRR